MNLLAIHKKFLFKIVNFHPGLIRLCFSVCETGNKFGLYFLYTVQDI